MMLDKYLIRPLLLRHLHEDKEKLPREVINEVELHSYKIQKQYESKITLEPQEGELYGNKPKSAAIDTPSEYDLLSNIIKTLNDTYGLNLTDEDRIDFERIREQLHANEQLMSLFNVDNSQDNIRDKFNEELDSVILQFINTKLELYNKLSEDKANAMIKRVWFNDLYDRLVRRVR